MRVSSVANLVFLLGSATAAFAQQNDLSGKDQYPQYRVLSGLPGGGFGVLPSGRPSIDGAAALATPIGYALGNHGAIGLFNTTTSLNPFQFDGRNAREQNSNGTAFFMVGGSYAGFHGTASYMILSTHLDAAFNFQVSAPLIGRLGLAVGVQDLDGGGGAAGTGFSLALDRRSSRSVFAVGTYDLGNRAYVSLGVGDRRFRGAFGNASAPIAGRLRGLVEYDAFNFNGGLLYNMGPFHGLGEHAKGVESNLFVGLVRAKYATVGLTFTR